MEWTPIQLFRECEAADKLRDLVCETWDDRLGRYYGTAYGYTQGEYWPENYGFTWVSYILPQLVFQNPRVRIGSGKLGDADFQAKGLETAINRWVKDTDYRVHLKEMAFGMGFLWGISVVRPEPVGFTFNDRDDPTWRPTATRINPRLFSMDPVSSGMHDARFMQHVSIEDRDRLLEHAKDHPEEGWNRALIEKMSTVRATDLIRSKVKDTPDRQQVAWREIWCAEVNDYVDKDDDPDDYHGTIYTLPLYPSSEYEPDWVRPPRAFFGPRWGPYTVFGAYQVPNCPYPLAPLVASDPHCQEVNAQALANYRSARNRKRIGIFDEAETGIGEKISKAPDGSAIGVPGFDKQHWQETEIGGVTETGLAQEEHARAMADRMLGITDQQRGSMGTGALATEVLEATAASNVRTSDLKEQFTAHTRRELMTVAWYMWKMDKVVVPFTKEEQAQIQQQFGLPPDKIPKGWSGADNVGPFDALELNIEPYSMQRTDEPMMQARAMQAIQVATQIYPIAAQMPQAIPGLKKLLTALGDAMNWPGFGDILPDNIAQQGPGPQQQPGQPGGGQPGQMQTPRLAGDLGIRPQGIPSGSGAVAGADKRINGKLGGYG